MLLLIGIPVIDACAGDARGVVACIRDQLSHKFGLTGTPEVSADVPAQRGTPPVETPAVPGTVVGTPAATPMPVATLAEAATPVAEVPVEVDTPQVVANWPEAPVLKLDAAVQTPPRATAELPAPAAPALPISPAPEPVIALPTLPDAPPAAAGVAPEPAAPDAVPEPEPVTSDAANGAQPQPGNPATEVATLDDRPGAAQPSADDAPPGGILPGIAQAPAIVPAIAVPAALPLTPPMPDLDLLAPTPPIPDRPVGALPPALPSLPPVDPDLLLTRPDAPLAVAALPAAPPALVPEKPLAVAATSDVPPMPPVLQPQATESVDPIELSEISPPPPARSPEIVKLPVFAPTIDAIEIEGDSNFVAGEGPEGATVRLYVDDRLVGESPVAGGRWLVEGVDLLGQASRLLRIEAIDAATGKLLGSTAVSFEIELPKEPAADPENDAAPPAAEPEAAAEPDAAPPAPPAVAARPEPTLEQPPADDVDAATLALPTEQPEPAEGMTAAADPSAEPADQPLADTPPVEAPAPLPPITPITPTETSASVTILAPPASEEPTMLPPIAEIDHAPAVEVLPLASAANLLLPAGRHIPVIRAYPIGDLDAHRFASGKAIIRRGDTLWSIAHRYYGHGIHFWTIVHANRDRIRRPSRIYPGQVFDLPLVTDE